jgi:hypothetical protein
MATMMAPRMVNVRDHAPANVIASPGRRPAPSAGATRRLRRRVNAGGGLAAREACNPLAARQSLQVPLPTRRSAPGVANPPPPPGPSPGGAPDGGPHPLPPPAASGSHLARSRRSTARRSSRRPPTSSSAWGAPQRSASRPHPPGGPQEAPPAAVPSSRRRSARRRPSGAAVPSSASGQCSSGGPYLRGFANSSARFTPARLS